MADRGEWEIGWRLMEEEILIDLQNLIMIMLAHVFVLRELLIVFPVLVLLLELFHMLQVHHTLEPQTRQQHHL
jgi:hypothetical protein